MYSKLPPRFGDAPTKVVFDGVEPGSAEAQRLYHENADVIGAFQQKARQSIVISEQPGGHMQQTLPEGGALRYSYNEGLETIHVRLQPTTRQPTRDQVEQGVVPWDFALVEITVPDLTKTSAVFSAFVRSSTQNSSGIARDDHGGVAYSPKPWVEYASDSELILAVVSDEVEQVSSLKVDLTYFLGSTSVVIDIYGYINKYDEDGPPNIVGSQLAAITGRELDRDSPRPLYAPKLKGRAIFTGGNTPNVVAAFPELAGYKEVNGVDLYSDVKLFNIYYGYYNPSVRWESEIIYEVTPTDILSDYVPPTAGISGGYVEEIEGVLDPPYDISYWDSAKTILKHIALQGSLWRETFETPRNVWHAGPFVPNPVEGTSVSFYTAAVGRYYLPIYGSDPIPQDTSRVATLSTLFFRGDQMDAVSKHQSSTISKVFYKWEGTGNYPGRWKLLRDKHTIPMTSMDTPSAPGPENHFGMPLLGTITLDPVHAGATWQPA